MDSMSEIEAKLNLIKEVRQVETAIEICSRGQSHGAIIRSILAEDAAESERSVNLLFSLEDSGKIFAFTETVLKDRLEILKTKVGV